MNLISDGACALYSTCYIGNPDLAVYSETNDMPYVGLPNVDSMASNIELMCTAIHDKLTSISAIEHGLSALLFYICNGKMQDREAVADANGIAYITTAMNAHISSTKVAEYGCGLLFLLAEHSSKRTTLIIENNGVQTVCAAMQEHAEESEDVACNGCAALTSLKVWTNLSADMFSICLTAVYKVIHHYVDSENVSSSACGILTNLVKRNMSRCACIAPTLVKDICTYMKIHKNSHYASKYGCSALANLAHINEKVREEIIKYGGILCIASAIENHSHSVKVVDYGCIALAIISTMNSVICMDDYKSILKAICTSMTAHNLSSDIITSSCTTLCNVDGAGDIDVRCVEVVCRVLVTHMNTSDYLVSYICAALAKIVFTSKNREKLCIRVKDIDNIYTVLERYIDSKIIAVNCCSVLFHIVNIMTDEQKCRAKQLSARVRKMHYNK